MTLEPVGERIIVKRLMENERGKLIIPNQLKEASLVGRVVAKGPDATWVEVGEIVLFGRYAGFKLPVDGKYIAAAYEDCLLMNCEDVISKVCGDAEAAPKEEALAAHG